MNETSLSFLYKTDLVYALCLPDLINAKSKPRINQFLREQRNLTELLKRIERSQLSRKEQLNEEMRQLSLLKRRKLPPIDSHIPCLEGKESQRLFTKDFQSLSTAMSSGQKADTTSTASSCKIRLRGLVVSSRTKWNNSTDQIKASREGYVSVLPIESNQNGQTPKLLRKEFSAQQSENICKNISYAAYNVT